MNLAILSLSSGVKGLPYSNKLLIYLIILNEAKALFIVVAIVFALS